MRLVTLFSYILITGLWLVLLCENASAQAWTRKKGGGYTQLGFSNISANELFTNQEGLSGIQLRREVTDNTLQFYGEYGITDKFTLVSSVPLKILETGTEIFSTESFPDTLSNGSLTALGNVSIAGVYGLPKTGSWVASVKLRLDLNTAAYDKTSGLRSGFDAWGFAPSLNGGYGSNYFFATAEVGINLRTNTYSHQFFSNLQAGVNYNQRIFLIGVLEILQSFENGSFNDANALHTGLYVNDLDFVAFQIKLGGYPTKNLGIWLSSGGGSSGDFVAKGRALSLAVSYQWNKK